MVMQPVVLVAATAQLEGVSGKKTTRYCTSSFIQLFSILRATHIVIVCPYCQFFSFSNGGYACSTNHPPGTMFHNYEYFAMYAMMII
jgi:hypothetical protein